MIRTRRSISAPIALGVVTVALSIGLLVGWILVIVQNLFLTEEVAQNSVLLALGSASFVIIITVLVLFSVFLVREIRTVNRQTRFVDSVTHELKSPLASLKLCLETLERSDLAPSQRIDLRQMMSDDVERLSSFIDDVLEASRLSHRLEGHALEDVVLRELVESCVDGTVRHYKQPADAISVRVPRDLVLVTDRTALETVIKNLLDNALKYSLGLEQAVEISVSARREAGYIYIEVGDRGVGIPREHHKRIFERFYRVPDETVRARRGTGLGLFVVSALVRVLGGKVSVRSEGIGRGTMVQVRVPVGQREEKKASTSPGDLAVSGP